MAKDTRRVAGSGVRAQCNRRGCLRRRTAKVAEACPSGITSSEISFEKQDASAEQVIHAGHFSHSGRFA